MADKNVAVEAAYASTEKKAGLRLLAYPRVSTEGQIDAYGLASQRTDITMAAEANGHTIVDWMEERGKSGTLDETGRPTFFECLERIENDPEVDGMIVANLGRFSRMLTVQEACLAKVWSVGGELVSALEGLVLRDDPEDPMRTAMRQMAGVFYQLDRGMVNLRLRKGRKEKAAAGGYAYGAPPYGWESHRETGKPSRLVKVPAEQRWIRQMTEWRGEGMHYHLIAEKLNGLGVATKRGGQWDHRRVARVIERGTELH